MENPCFLGVPPPHFIPIPTKLVNQPKTVECAILPGCTFHAPRYGLTVRLLLTTLFIGGFVVVSIAAPSLVIPADRVQATLTTLTAEADTSREFTWWFPKNADALVLPVAAGIEVKNGNTLMMDMLKNRSPWELNELPVLGARYDERTLVVIVPWPHYAEFVLEQNRLGVRFHFPQERNNVTPCDVVVQWAGADPLEPARVFREWRATAENIGGLNRPRPLTQKIKDLPKAGRLLGAPHFYLWGPAMFSKHDVPRAKWVPLAKALQSAAAGTEKAKIREQFSKDQQGALKELAAADWPMGYLTIAVAAGIEQALQSRALLGLSANISDAEVVAKNRASIAKELKQFARNPNNWGDGPSTVLLDELKGAGIDHAVLTLCDLYGGAIRPDVAVHADELGYLIGPYDSYHSVHSPDAGPDDTWETAQFDEAAFAEGRVVKEPGRRQGGFMGRGFHLAPEAARPYVEKRVGDVLANNGYSSWFIDCDATAECFDDYNPLHPATRVDDMNIRRSRLQWLEKEKRLVVGSEGGSVLFADVIHFGHGVHTPYIGHLFPGFRDPDSKYYLGRHWPPDTPGQSFRPVDAPAALITPYFDPRVRIPLYQAAVGDELIATHHWSFDSMKFGNIRSTRALFEILYMVPPMYHVNRETWSKRKDAILHHVNFWSPLHQQLAEAQLIKFERFGADNMVQRTTYQTRNGPVRIIVNFSDSAHEELAPRSATIEGAIRLRKMAYQVME